MASQKFTRSLILTKMRVIKKNSPFYTSKKVNFLQVSECNLTKRLNFWNKIKCNSTMNCNFRLNLPLEFAMESNWKIRWGLYNWTMKFEGIELEFVWGRGTVIKTEMLEDVKWNGDFRGLPLPLCNYNMWLLL